jgi:hypothetical protein
MMYSLFSANEKDKSFANGEESARLTTIHLGLSLGLTTLLKGLCVKKGQKLFLNELLYIIF